MPQKQAEQGRFELPMDLRPMPDFKSGAFNRSATAPGRVAILALNFVVCDPLAHRDRAAYFAAARPSRSITFFKSAHTALRFSRVGARRMYAG